MEEDIAQIWHEVEDRVLRMANGDRSQLNEGMDIEGVLRHLESTQASDQKASEASKRVRGVISGTLASIQTVGEVVANVASNVFPPANLCYGAIVMVIKAWQGCEGVFEDLAGLIARCGEFLERLSSYIQTGMDSRLTRVACQHLKLFVDICDRALVLRKKHIRVKIFLKQLFLKDEYIKGALDQMRSVNDRELMLITAQTWKSSNETAANSKETNTKLDSLVGDKTQQKRKEDMHRWIEIVMKTLEFPQSTIDKEMEGKIQDWEEGWQSHKTRIFDGSGDWISEDPQFRTWIRGSDSGTPILGVEGKPGTGKSLVASNVIMQLRKLSGAETSNSRSIVAYHFLESNSKVISDRDSIADSVSRTVLWQIAKAHTPFLRSAADICGKAGFFKGSSDMWKNLLFENEAREKMDSTFFIVIDGLVESVDALAETFKEISANPDRHRIRLLLTGPESLFNDLSKTKGIEVDRVKLGKSNMQDIELYINTRLDRMETLKDRKNLDVSETRQKITHALEESTDGDYYKLGQDLDNLAGFDEIEEIEAYLVNVGKSRPDQTRALIEKLNQDRTPKEIAEMNEIILWIDKGLQWLNVPQIEAALAYRTGRSVSRSLGSLESKIRKRYSLFCINDTGAVRYVADDISGMIPKKKRNASDDEGHDGVSEIIPAEINMIKHYLLTVCPPDVYTKFNFDQFFQMKMVRKSNHICSDPDNGHITLALRCLTCLTEQRTSKTEELHVYAKRYIYGHLKAVDLSLADRDLKTEVGVLLAKLFADEFCSDSLFKPILDRHMSSEAIRFTLPDTPRGWDSWVLCDDGVNVIDTWLKDSAVLEKIGDVAWVKEFRSAEADRHKFLLEVASRMAATRLFREQSTKKLILYDFLFLSAVLYKASMKRPDKVDDTTYLDLFRPTLHSLRQVEEWAQKCLGVTDKDARWEAQAAVLLLHLSNEGTPITKKHSAARARRARDLDPENWSAIHTLALATETPAESLGLLETLVERLTKDDKWLEEADHQTTLAEMMLDLGDRLWISTDKTDSAIVMYSRSLDFGRAEHLMQRYRSVLKGYAVRKLWQTIVLFLEKLLQTPDGKPDVVGKLLIPRWGHEFEETFVEVLAPTFRATSRWDLLDVMCKKAIQDCPHDWRMYSVRYYYGLALCSRKDGGEDIALQIWEELLFRAAEPSEAYVRPSIISLVSGQKLPYLVTRAFPKDVEVVTPVKEYCDKIEVFYKDFRILTHQDSDTCILYARYFKLRDNTLEAKKLAKEIIAQCLEMLSDDKLENDFWACWDLGRVFLILEDIPNAFVAWEMMSRSDQAVYDQWLKKKEERDIKQTDKKTVDFSTEADEVKIKDENENDDDSDEQEKGTAEATRPETNPADAKSDGASEDEEPPLVVGYTCDYCDRDFRFLSEVWTCLDEGGSVQLDEECYQKLQEGTLERRVCDKNHHHYHVGKRDEKKLAEVPVGSVLRGDEIMTLEAWKREIKAIYVDAVNSAV